MYWRDSISGVGVFPFILYLGIKGWHVIIQCVQCGECQAGLQVESLYRHTLQFRDQEVHQRERVIKNFSIWNSKFQNRHIGSQYSSDCLCTYLAQMLSDLILIMCGELQLDNKSLKVALMVQWVVHLWNLLEYVGLFLNFNYVLIIMFIYTTCMRGMCMEDPYIFMKKYIYDILGEAFLQLFKKLFLYLSQAFH